MGGRNDTSIALLIWEKMCEIEIRTDEMTKSCPKFNLGLNEGIAVAVESHEENFLHLVGELAEARQRRWGDW